MIIQNIIFSKFIGCCPFFGVSKKIDSAIGMSLAVIFVIVMSSALTWLGYKFLLVPFNLEYLRIILFILVIAAFVQFVEMAIAKFSPGLYKALGIFLPLITTNCAVLAATILNIEENLSFIQSLFNGFAIAAGFGIAILILAGIREKLEFTSIPKPFLGLPISFMCATCLALAFMGFSGMQI
jgi:electron transport complex protein RnfA